MRRKTIVLGLLISCLGGLGLFAWIQTGSQAKEHGWIPAEKDWDMPVDPPPKGDSSLEVTVELSKPAIRVGEQLPVQVYLRNRGNSGVTVLGTLHNSEFFRYPLCGVQIVDQNGNRETWQPAPRCGNTNPLDLSDFHDLQPGQQIKLHHEMLHAWTPPRPGTYTITYLYDSRGKVLGAWHPFGGPGWSPESAWQSEAILSRLKTVAQDLVVSKPQSIEVMP